MLTQTKGEWKKIMKKKLICDIMILTTNNAEIRTKNVELKIYLVTKTITPWKPRYLMMICLRYLFFLIWLKVESSCELGSLFHTPHPKKMSQENRAMNHTKNLWENETRAAIYLSSPITTKMMYVNTRIADHMRKSDPSA